MAGKNLPENNPQESEFFEDLAERVFKDYEPPKPAGPAEEIEEEDDADGNENQQAA